jgi:hypothetical protein
VLICCEIKAQHTNCDRLSVFWCDCVREKYCWLAARHVPCLMLEERFTIDWEVDVFFPSHQ